MKEWLLFLKHKTQRGVISALFKVHTTYTHTQRFTQHTCMHACTHTHPISHVAHTHTHPQSLTQRTHMCAHTYTLFLSHILSFSHTHSLSLRHTHTHTHTQAPHTHTHAHFCSFYPPATGTEHFSLSQLALTLISISIMSSLAGFSGSFITSSSRTALIWRSLNWQM